MKNSGARSLTWPHCFSSFFIKIIHLFLDSGLSLPSEFFILLVRVFLFLLLVLFKRSTVTFKLFLDVLIISHFLVVLELWRSARWYESRTGLAFFWFWLFSRLSNVVCVFLIWTRHSGLCLSVSFRTNQISDMFFVLQ